MIYIGIDPGLTGAVAVLRPHSSEVHDLPTVAAGRGTVKRELDPQGVLRLLQAASGPDPARAVIERTSAMPGQGVASMFSMGVTRGILLASLAAAGIPYEEVAPATWKRAFNLVGADKDQSRRLALQIFPARATSLARVKDHNRAEALLLAEWLRKRNEVL